MVNSLYQIRFLRAIALPILKSANRDISIRHHWTGKPVRLNLFAHKGYWYHGQKREKEEMLAIQALVELGDVVVEVGGHIGYITLLLSQAAGNGRVIVFEPGSNNLPYIRSNVAAANNVTLIEKGCGSRAEEMVFHEDSLTGQNNSFVSEFSGLESNAANAPNVQLDINSRSVEVVRLDQEVPKAPSFIKIDVEGFELAVLEGATGWFDGKAKPPVFMIEVQADHGAIAEWFRSRGYELFDIDGKIMSAIPETTLNLFALMPEAHAYRLERWRSSAR